MYHQELRQGTLEMFGLEFGDHVKRYLFRVFSFLKREWVIEMGRKVITLLSCSPELTELELHSNCELYVSDHDLHLLPTSLPRLRHIRISDSDRGSQFRTPYPLVDYIVHRATELKTYKFTMRNRIQSLRILSFLVQTRPIHLPDFSFEGNLELYSGSNYGMSYVQELMDLQIRFREMSLKIHGWADTGLWSLLRGAYAWLELQSSTLTDLRLEIDLQDIRSTFPLPASMPALTSLTIIFPQRAYARQLITLPVDYNFPVLKKLCLENDSVHLEMFQTRPIPSVEELHLPLYRNPIPDESWLRRAFPNLSSIFHQE